MSTAKRLLTLAALVLAGCAAPPVADSGSTATPLSSAGSFATPPAALHVEGAPPLTPALLQATARYNRVAGHAFVEWHPTLRQMLVRHRAPGASTTQLYRVAAPGAAPEALTDARDPVAEASYEPQHGDAVVLARGSGGDEAWQLFRLDPRTHATTQLTPSGERHTLFSWLKLTSQPLALVGSVPLDRTAATGSRTDVATTLWLLDPKQPGSRRVVAELPGGGWFDARVAPDESRFAITRYVSATESEVWLVDLRDATWGQRTRLLPAPESDLKASHFVVEWARDGRHLYVLSDRVGEFRELMRLDLTAGASQGTLLRLTADTPWDVESSSQSPDGRMLAVVVNVDGRDELRLLDAAIGTRLPMPAGVTLPEGSITAATFHPQRNELALVVNSVRGPSQIESIDFDAAGAARAVWTQPAGTDGLDLRKLPPQQIVSWRSFDGRSISGVLSLPPARFPGARPVLMSMHGGPEGQSQQGWQGRLNYLIQELGIAVLQPNVRGSSGYGKTYLGLDNGHLREDSVKDMAAAIDWLGTHPRLDARRVLVQGGSYGGYMALAASTQLADRISGAVAVVGISNFVSFLERTESYRRDLRRAEYGDERDPVMRALLQQISPLNHVDRIDKPLMVVQGKNDPRVPWTESEQIVRSLQARGKPVWYLLADNEGHGFVRRENADFYFATLVQFAKDVLSP